MVDFVIERYFILLIISLIYLHQRVDSESTPITADSGQSKQSKGSNEKQTNIDTSNVYTSSKANEFLSYDKCIQRMKCASIRKEECNEECRAGNTEEEIEEHNELAVNERVRSKTKKSKTKPEVNKNIKKRTNKSKQPSDSKQQSNNLSSEATTKTEL